MTDYVISSGRSSAYPTSHFGGHFIGSRATFCELADLKTPSANVLAMPNAPVVVLTPSAITVTDKFLGAHVTTRSNDSSTATTIKTVRSHDIANGKGRWSKIQPTSSRTLSSWDFTDLDSWVNTHYAAGRDLIFTLYATPYWASARPSEPCAYSFGTYGSGTVDLNYGNFGIAAEPSDMADWDFYCTTIANRYLGKIKYYEVNNEPNIGNDGVGDGIDGTGLTAAGKSAKNYFFSGKFGKLAEMTRRAAVIIKTIDPTAKIISPPVQGWVASGTDTSGAYFAGMMAQSTGDGSTILKDHIDIVGVHLYTTNITVDLAGSVDRALAARAAASLTGKEIWDTESSPTTVQAVNLSDARLIRYFTRFLITVAAKGIHRHIYYTIDNTASGFLSRTAVVSHWNTLRTLLMSGTIQSASKIWDGRIVYWVAGVPYIV
jgi:hypothetical protein